MKISIVTPSFNQCGFLARTADSILSQTGGFDLEWIVIDAASTDGSVALLRGLSDPRVRVVSEPDRGQSHAINKGLAMASGQIVAYLNADDLYAPGALGAVAATFERDPQAQWVVGGCEIIDADDRPIRAGVMRYKQRRLRRYSYRALLRENFIPQPAVFWRQTFGQTIGPVDESLHYTMDYDLWLRMGLHCPPTALWITLARFRLHAQSKSGQFNRRQFDEGYQVACRYAGADPLSRLVHLFNVEKIVLAYRLMRWLGM